MNFLKLRVIFITIAVIYILIVPTVLADNNLGDYNQSEEHESVEKNVFMEEKDLPVQKTGVEYKMRLFTFEGREMLQLKDLAKNFGWSLYYNSTAKEIRISNKKGSTILGLKEVKNDSIELIEGRTYLSLEMIAELFNSLEEESALITAMYTEQKEYMAGDTIEAHIRVFNPSAETIKLDFASGQRYDLYLLKDKEEVWRWSDGRFFTMALVQKEIKPGEKLTYDVEIDADLKAGEYILSGELSTIPAKIELNELFILILDK